MPPPKKKNTYFPLILQWLAVLGILQGHCVVKLGMDEDLLEQVTHPSDWVGWKGAILEATTTRSFDPHIVVMIVLVVVGC